MSFGRQLRRNKKRLQMIEAQGAASVVTVNGIERPALATMSARQIWDELLSDMTSTTEPPINRFVPGLAKIAEAWKQTPEQVFVSLTSAVVEKTGSARQVGTPGGYRLGDSTPVVEELT